MEYRHFYLARRWAREGHEVHILCASYSHLRKSNPILGNKKKYEEDEEGVKFHYVRTRAYSGNGLGRIFNMFEFSVRIGAWRAEYYRPDIVLASSPHLFIAPAARRPWSLGSAACPATLQCRRHRN